MALSADESKGQVSAVADAAEAKKAADNVDNLDTLIIKDISKLGKSTLKTLDGFRTFILRGNVVDLAIGIVIGAAFTAVVNALVADLITPLIPVSGSSSLSNWSITIPNTYIKNIHIGAFINSVISFLIVAAVLYFFVVQPVNSFMKLYRKEPEKSATAECPHCFQTINAKATRCPFCTSHIKNNGENHNEAEAGADDPVLLLPASLEKLSDKLAESIVRKATSSLEAGVTGSPAASSEETTTEK